MSTTHSPDSALRPRPGLPNWVISTIVIGVVTLAIASTIQKLISSPETGSIAQHVPKAHSPEAPPAPPPPPSTPEPKHPYAEFIEVTDLKLIELADRTQVQYQVVNHSATPLSDIGISVVIRSQDAAPGVAPLFTLQARVPTLGPHASKEIRTDLDGHLKLREENSNLVMEVKTRLEP